MWYLHVENVNHTTARSKTFCSLCNSYIHLYTVNTDCSPIMSSNRKQILRLRRSVGDTNPFPNMGYRIFWFHRFQRSRVSCNKISRGQVAKRLQGLCKHAAVSNCLVCLLFYIDTSLYTAAGVVPCGGRKKSPRTSSIVQVIFYLGPLRSVKIFRVFKIFKFRNILLSNVLNYLTPFRNVSLI